MTESVRRFLDKSFLKITFDIKYVKSIVQFGSLPVLRQVSLSSPVHVEQLVSPGEILGRGRRSELMKNKFNFLFSYEALNE